MKLPETDIEEIMQDPPDMLQLLQDLLSPRQLVVLALVVDGKKYREIGELLGLSTGTCHTYMARAVEKLRYESIKRAIIFLYPFRDILMKRIKAQDKILLNRLNEYEKAYGRYRVLRRRTNRTVSS